MLAMMNASINRILLFLGLSVISLAGIYAFSFQAIHHIPTIAPMLFPVMTVILMIFHSLIATFMVMKFLCDKKRLYLMGFACAFGGSALLMSGTLSCYSDWLQCPRDFVINYNDAMIFFLFRNLMMSILFIGALMVYKFGRSNTFNNRQIFITLSLFFSVTILMSALSWLCSSKFDVVNIELISNQTRQFTPLWTQLFSHLLIAIWSIALLLVITFTQLRNVFWYSGAFFCVFFIFTLILLSSSSLIAGVSWYQSRLFEVTATLILIVVLMSDVFALYRDSKNKYLDSYQNSIRDPLTRLFNRSYFYDTLIRLRPGLNSTNPVSIIVCDLDHFKRINDQYGHLQGDKVIQYVANILMNSVRKSDIAARIGGEEFALLLVGTSQQDAWAIAESIRQTIGTFDPKNDSHGIAEPVTISMGIFTTTNKDDEVEGWVQRADMAMYQAKEAGRNRVVIWKP